MRNRQGFSLVELIITVAVVGILATISVPNFQGMIQRFRFYGAVQTLSSDLALTRLKAISNNLQYRLKIDQANDSYVIAEGNAAQSSSVWTGKSSNTMPSGVDIYQVESISSDEVIFNPDGTLDESSESPPDNYGRIYIRSESVDKHKRIFIMAITGRMTVELLMGATWKDERYLVND